jgi:hypothetical protein
MSKTILFGTIVSAAAIVGIWLGIPGREEPTPTADAHKINHAESLVLTTQSMPTDSNAVSVSEARPTIAVPFEVVTPKVSEVEILIEPGPGELHFSATASEPIIWRYVIQADTLDKLPFRRSLDGTVALVTTKNPGRYFIVGQTTGQNPLLIFEPYILGGEPPPPPDELEIRHFRASPDKIQSGQSSTLSWQVSPSAATVTLDSQVVSATGQKVVSPQVTMTYQLKATYQGEQKLAPATVTVDEKPPPPDDVAWLVIIEETGDRTVEHGDVIASQKLRDHLKSNDIELWVTDDDTTDEDDKQLADLLKWLRETSSLSLPVMLTLDAGGDIIDKAELGSTVDDVLDFVGS